MLFARALACVGLERRDARLLGRPADAGEAARGLRRLRPCVRRVLAGPVRRAHGRAGRSGRGDRARVRRAELPAADEDAPDPSCRRMRPVLSVRWSPTEMLRHVDFAAYTPAEFAEARKLMSDLRFVGAIKPSRRRRPSAKRRGHARRAAHGPPRAAHGRGADRRGASRSRDRDAAASSCCSTSAGRWSRTRARSCASCTRPSSGARRSRRSRSARDSRASRSELSSRDPDAAVAAAAQPRHRLVGRHPARRGPAQPSTTRGASAAWRAARWS